MRIFATLLAATLAASLPPGAAAEPAARAMPRAIRSTDDAKKEPAPARRLEPAGNVAPRMGVQPAPRGAAARKAAAGQASPLTGKMEAITTQKRGLRAAVVNQPGLTFGGECAAGFAKEIKPDHPAGFYECRLPASPACATGFKHDDVLDAPPNQFRYECEEWTGSSGSCPPGWTKSSAGVFDYYCTSAIFQCKTSYQLGSVSRSGPTPSPGGGDGAALYKYRCDAL